MSTNTHFDHNALQQVSSRMLLDRMAGTWNFGDVRITGIANKHQYAAPGPVKWTDIFYERGLDPVPPNNPPVQDNNSYLLETGACASATGETTARTRRIRYLRPSANSTRFFLPLDDSLHVLSWRTGRNHN